MTRPIMQHYRTQPETAQRGGLGDETGGNAPFTLWLGDCLDRMGEIPDGSVDMILADLPYGTTACKWDTVIPFEPLWAHYKRVTKPDAAIVLTASQPFTSALVMSNPKWFRYEWVWRKNKASNFADLDKRPGKAHENVCVFYGSQPTYNKQDTLSEVKGRKFGASNGRGGDKGGGVFRAFPRQDKTKVLRKIVSPKSVLDFSTVPNASGRLHPTQKPVALMEYLIRTYTNPGETVLDNTMGSGTTGVACVTTGRNFIGIEREAEYFDIAARRIAEAQPELFA